MTADGSINIIADKGDVKFSPILILKNVLYVPKLKLILCQKVNYHKT